MIKKIAHQVEAKDLPKLVKQAWSESLGPNLCQHHMVEISSKINEINEIKKILAL